MKYKRSLGTGAFYLHKILSLPIWQAGFTNFIIQSRPGIIVVVTLLGNAGLITERPYIAVSFNMRVHAVLPNTGSCIPVMKVRKAKKKKKKCKFTQFRNAVPLSHKLL